MSIKETSVRLWPLALASAAAGAVGAFAFPPIHIPWLMFISLGVFLFVVSRDIRYRDGFVLGFIYGLSYMAILIWWMNAVDYRAYIALTLVQALMFALIGMTLRIVILSSLWPVIGATVWVASETLRGSQPFGGFPWGRLAHITADTFLDSWVRFLGMAGTSALIFFITAIIVRAIIAPTKKTAIIAAGAVFATVIGALVLPTGIAGPIGTANIAIVQGNTPGDFGTWHRGEIFRLHIHATEQLIADIDSGAVSQPDFVIWPENSLDVDPETNEWVANILTSLEKDLNAPILIGAILDGPNDDTAFNAGIVWENGGETARYVKRNLVPYGEYVPFRQVLGNLVPRFRREIPRDLLPGNDHGTITIAGTSIGDTICWDIAYDRAIIDNVRSGAELLVTQTSNASFTATSQPDQQWLITQLRAVETGRDLVVASTNGISGVIAADGTVLDELPKHQPGVISAEVELAHGFTPAVIFGRYLMWILVIIGVGSIAWLYRKERGARTRHHSDI